MAVENYCRFWRLLRRLPGEPDKEAMVEEYTGGRTAHLHEMRREEYERMCADMERLLGYDERREAQRKALRRARSGVLHQMQLWGVDTADWQRVDRFCQDPRIAGKYFRNLDTDELDELHRKLRAMNRKKQKGTTQS